MFRWIQLVIRHRFIPPVWPQSDISVDSSLFANNYRLLIFRSGLSAIDPLLSANISRCWRSSKTDLSAVISPNWVWAPTVTQQMTVRDSLSLDQCDRIFNLKLSRQLGFRTPHWRFHMFQPISCSSRLLKFQVLYNQVELSSAMDLLPQCNITQKTTIKSKLRRRTIVKDYYRPSIWKWMILNVCRQYCKSINWMLAWIQ